MSRTTGLLSCIIACALIAAACSSEEPIGDLGTGDGDEAGAVEGDDDAEDADAGDPAADDANAGGEITIALADEPDALDPTIATTLVARMVLVNMCERLYDVNVDMEIVPQLAADLPEFSDDGLTVDIPLRDGILFNDGSEFDADAVKVTLDRHRELDGSARQSDLQQIESVEVVDELTVRLNLSEAFAPLTATLADRAGFIMSAEQLDVMGEDFAQDPVCVGPFEFVERVAQDRIVLERAEEFYYDADAVNLDRVTFLTVSDANVRTASLRSGEFDFAERIQTTDVDQLEEDADLELVTATTIGYQGITINVGNTDGVGNPFGESEGPMADPVVREAFELIVDRDVINDVVFNGRMEIGCSPISPVSPAFNDVECSERDPERALELLEEAGYDIPVPIELMVSTNTEDLRFAELLQSLAEDGGFAIEVNPTEFATSLQEAGDGDFETYYVSWSGVPDADGNTHRFHHSTGSINYAGGNDDDIDTILDAARQETDESARQDLYDEAVDMIRERRSIIYLFHQNLFMGKDASVSGFEFYSDGLPRFKTAGFTS